MLFSVRFRSIYFKVGNLPKKMYKNDKKTCGINGLRLSGKAECGIIYLLGGSTAGYTRFLFWKRERLLMRLLLAEHLREGAQDFFFVLEKDA